jgi:membrane protease YdiL (CAAX protease family)
VVVAVVLSGCGMGAATWLLPYLELDPHAIRAGLDDRFQMGPAGALLVVVFLSVVNSGLEELHFRAWLDRELSARWGAAAGIAASSLAFGGMHVLIFLGMPDLPAAAVVLVPLSLAIAGAVWSLLMRRPGGIHAAWLSHGLTDALLLGWGLHWLDYV